MKVINIHKRIVNQPKEKIIELVNTLSTKDDQLWPKEQWPRMKLNRGLQEGSVGGHGPVGYNVERYQPGKLIQFRFNKPRGFNGIHAFEIIDLGKDTIELKHTIDMNTSFIGTCSWLFAVRWLHDALIEDAFDKLENHFTGTVKFTEWNLWVRFLRFFLK